ncbi:uncharacterized protein MELLADRAFT_71427 [Melampsora larici-populina 98AG31]|uniref:Uncharacterized protein n=1 Tax=Melampsora larici-populina (strain 98AG31 / pathotype 3-4-7) TaxID=747676 RepID=F4RGK5_MELLP|nr:uncharacterized protein MELLADRAFT_71427 [Melampsora larici-populina 98AG31]EGG08634.1 hypothetical protein MELLADRAFT_71427 [Melampsora larici-populina 98AG31]
MSYIGFVFNGPFWSKLTRKNRSRKSTPSSISSSSNSSIESTPKPQRTRSFIHQGREPSRVSIYGTCRPLDSSYDPVYSYGTPQSQPSTGTPTFAIDSQILHDSPKLIDSQHHGCHSSIQVMFSLSSYEEKDQKLVTGASLLIGPNPPIEEIEKPQCKSSLQQVFIPDQKDLESEKGSPTLGASLVTRERSNLSLELQSYFEDDTKSETSSLLDYQTEIECLPRSIFEDDSDDEAEGSILTKSRARSSSVGTTNTTSISIPSIVLSIPVGDDSSLVDQHRFRIRKNLSEISLRLKTSLKRTNNKNVK